MAGLNNLKKFKLKVHQSNFSEESLVLNAKDFPDVKEDDIVKIFNCDGDHSDYLVIKVKSMKKEGELQKETVSIEQTIASRFGLHAFQSVYVVKVDPVDISLDMLEVTFKDQYISRSDMWRLKKDLVGSCTCLDEKIEFSDIRAQVSELWINSSKVKCGLITNDTKIVLRSASALVYIFVQMSSEMWDFDAYGQLQFERAVNGFLKDLFTKWKDKCYHEFTLVLFSRTFYNAHKIDEFPEDVRDVVQKDYKGSFYIDFYNCVAHHERSDDCTPLLFVLKKLFDEYKDIIKIPGCPNGYNSRSAEGNFLEAINMPLNVFEKHYLDRNFDRTGQLVMCITPGVGVFDVDRDLTVLTKERMIDNGIGSDLVCLGQQPLHAVPLFKFHQQNSLDPVSSNKLQRPNLDFNIPHWINHSFYSSNPFMDHGSTGIRYVPRVHLSCCKPYNAMGESFNGNWLKDGLFNNNCYSTDFNFLDVDYEEYDREIFISSKRTTAHSNRHFHQGMPKRSTSIEIKKAASHRIRTVSDEWKKRSSSPDEYTRIKQSNPLYIPHRQSPDTGAASSVGPAANLEKYLKKKEEEACTTGLVVGSAHSLQTVTARRSNPSRRALINPFMASYTLTPLTSNRRRWVHTFPQGPQGEVMVHHYHHSANTLKNLRVSERIRGKTSESTEFYDEDETVDMLSNNSPNTPSRIRLYPSFVGGSTTTRSNVGSVNSSDVSISSLDLISNSPKTCLVTDLSSQVGRSFPNSPGVDWKSLRSPACLPITNDYFPSRARLQNNYTEQSYNLIPDHEEQQFNGRADSDTLLVRDGDQGPGWQIPSHQLVSTRETFLELVNQRLCQGFQLVDSGRRGHRCHRDSTTSFSGRRSPSSACGDVSFISRASTSPAYSQISSETYTLNHGRQYHTVTLSGDNEILVKIYKPRHPFLTSTIEYKYLLWALSRDKYRMARVTFSHEQYESYYWNYQDNYVCCGGADSDFKLRDNIKYWRSRFIIIPSPTAKLRVQKFETEFSQKEGRSNRYDIFENENDNSLSENASDDFQQTMDGFIKFLEHINKIRRQPANTATLRTPWRMKPTNTVASLPTSLDSSSKSGNVPVSQNTQSTPTPMPCIRTAASGRSTPEKQSKMHSVPPNISVKLSSQDMDAKPVTAPHLQSNERSQNVSLLPAPNNTLGRGIYEGLEKKPLNLLSEVQDLTDAMRNERYHFAFLPHRRGLRGECFLSIEAVQWCILNVKGAEDVEDACKLFQRLCDGRRICHASGDFNHRFIHGFYIYYLTDGKDHDNDLNDPTSHQYDDVGKAKDRSFRDHWLEVEIKSYEKKQEMSKEVRAVRPRHKSALSSLLEKDSRSCAGKIKGSTDMKTVFIPMNNKHKTGRLEWCQVQYPCIVTPWYGSIVFTFNMQWMVATATCLFEMLQSWSREASRCHLCMLPAPNNPFAFPHSEGDASPLHCPLFVSVHFNVLLSESSDFQALYENGMECRKRIIHFMEKIAVRFGFSRYFDNHDPDAERNNTVNSRHYVHYTGQVFLEIPVTNDFQVQGRSLAAKLRSSSSGTPVSKQDRHAKGSILVSPKNKYQKSGFNIQSNEENRDLSPSDLTNSSPERSKNGLIVDLKSAGFYFSANHMMTKRWRISALDDCPASSLEADFVKFCANFNDRLLCFYDVCYKQESDGL